MRLCAAAFTSTALIVTASASAYAASLQASPMTVEIQAPGVTSMVTLKNEGADPVNAQIRVYRWSQVGGQEKLEPTTDVVASPPMATLAPKGDYLVRLVRLSKAPVAGEETYRILVDEIPDTSKQKPGINIAMRYSIPVFIEPKQLGGAKLDWSVERRDGKLALNVVNNGDRRVRISALKVTDGSGTSVVFGQGLVGYVLARSSMQWIAPGTASKLSSTGPVTITATGDTGPIHAQATSQASR
jgi:fimbrial chaperone protein